MKIAIKLLTIIVAVWCYEIKAEEVLVFRISTSFIDKNYTCTLYASRLAKTPSWKEEHDNPPLSLRKAFAAGRKYLAQMVKDPEKWDLEQITLRSVGEPGKWIYIIEVRQPLPPGGLEGKLTTSKLIVLMDGTVLEMQPMR
jgi:hypothetical protein